MAQPGWYPDPDGGPTRRFWDGNAWYSGIPAKPAQPMELRRVLPGFAGGIAGWLIVTVVGAVVTRPGGADFWAPSSATSVVASIIFLTVGFLMTRFASTRQAGAGVIAGVALVAIVWTGPCIVFGGQLSG